MDASVFFLLIVFHIVDICHLIYLWDLFIFIIKLLLIPSSRIIKLMSPQKKKC